jgi:hypothetical protein
MQARRVAMKAMYIGHDRVFVCRHIKGFEQDVLLFGSTPTELHFAADVTERTSLPTWVSSVIFSIPRCSGRGATTRLSCSLAIVSSFGPSDRVMLF